MSMIKYDPFKNWEQLFNDDFLGVMPGFRRHLDPAVDIYHTDTEVVVEMAAPKIDPSKIAVSVEDGILKVEANQSEEQVEEGKNYLRREIRRGGFVRMFSLPVAVKEESIEATYQNGILKISIPKQEIKQAKKVEVKVK